jgi:hypothetical protein
MQRYRPQRFNATLQIPIQYRGHSMNRPRRGLSALALILALAIPFSAEAQRQPVYQDGVILPNHLTKQTTTGLIKDAGTPAVGDAQGKGISPIGINDVKAPLGVCTYSADPTAPGTYLCLGHDTAGVPTVSVNSVGGAGLLGLNVNLNGTVYPFPGAGNGNVVGPTSPNPTALMLGCWNGGTSLIGCGTVPSTLGATFNAGWAGMGGSAYSGNKDMARITINDYPLSDEFGFNTYAITSGLVVGMVVPANAVGNAINAADQTIVAYGKTLSPIKGVAAVTGQSFMGASGSLSQVWGVVGNVINCQDAPCTGGGFGGNGIIYSAEFDMNLVPKTGGVAPDITAIGLHIANNSTTAVAANHLHAGINFTATSATFPWKTGIAFQVGSTATAILLSAAAPGVSQPSQIVKFASTKSDGSTLVAPIVLTALGTLGVTIPSPTGFFSISGGGLSVNQPVNGGLNTVYLTRATDTAPTGNLIIGVNAAQNATTFAIDVSGNAVFAGMSVTSLAGSAGAGGLNVCVDNVGVFYKKASCP